MGALVVIPVDPFPKELVESLEGKALGKGRQELFPDGEEEVFDLATTLGDLGPRVEERDAEPAADVRERIRLEGRASRALR